MEALTRESIRPLLELQRVDSAVDRLRKRRSDLPEQRELDEARARRDEIGAILAERRAALDDVVREQTKLENDIALVERKMSDEQARLYGGGVTSPKELSNIQAELDALRRRKTHVEDEDLELMERREGLEKEIAEFDVGATELERAVADVTARRDAATVEIDRELGSLGTERDRLVPTLDPELLELYEEMRVKKDGVAVGALEGGTCRACGLPLSPLALDAIKRSDDPLIKCENCRRLLIVP